VSQYKHIVAQQRVIKAYTLNGKSLSYIARQLNRSKSTINYELARVSPYTAIQAQIDYPTKRENCGCKRSLYLEAIDHILTHLKLGWSPESVVERFEKVNGKTFPISVSTIYRYAALGLFRLSQKLFIRKGKTLKNNELETRGKMPQLKEIHSHQAPRNEIGHWEVDTIIGKAHKCQIPTLTERTSHFTIIQKLSSKTATSTAQVIIQLLKKLPKKMVKTITADRGKEFHL